MDTGFKPGKVTLPEELKGLDVSGQAADIRRLSKPFWATVLIGAVSLLVFATILTQILDRHSISSSEQVFSSMLDDRSEHLAEITQEYGYWDIAVEKLVDTLDMKWVEETFVDYMQKELQIEGVHVLDAANMPKLHVIGGRIANQANLQALYGDAINGLVEKARETPANETPVPATGLVGGRNSLYLASAVRMTTYVDSDDISTDHVIVFARALDGKALREFARKYALPELHVARLPPSYWQAGYPAVTNDGNLLGYFVWQPRLAGTTILPLAVTGLIVVYVCMWLSARLFFRRATEMVRALDEARQQAVKATELLADQARRDPLTGLGNRRSLDEALARLEAQQVEGAVHAMLYVDLDYFKEINDSFGHETGDLVLQHVAVALRRISRSGEQVARLGGDEFIVVLGNCDRPRALRMARTIIDHFSKPLSVNGAECRFGASVGIAFSPNPDELLRQADMALYSAKRRGRGQLAVFSASLVEFGSLPVESAAV